jgi:hypothetical protein
LTQSGQLVAAVPVVVGDGLAPVVVALAVKAAGFDLVVVAPVGLVETPDGTAGIDDGTRGTVDGIGEETHGDEVGRPV